MSPESETNSKRCEKGNAAGSRPENVVDAAEFLPFCFVEVWPKDLNPIAKVEKAVRLFKKMDEQLLLISRPKAIDREKLIWRLGALRGYQFDEINTNINKKKELLAQLNQAFQKLSFARAPQRKKAFKSCPEDERLDQYMLDFKMLHRSKNIAEEKKLLKNMNVSQQRDAASSSPPAELTNLMSHIRWKYEHCHLYYNLKNFHPLLEELKQFDATKKITKALMELMRSEVKNVCDELMEMRTERQEHHNKIRDAERELETKNERIWGLHKDLRGKHGRKEATLFVLKQTTCGPTDMWILKNCNLEHESIHLNVFYLEKE